MILTQVISLPEANPRLIETDSPRDLASAFASRIAMSVAGGFQRITAAPRWKSWYWKKDSKLNGTQSSTLRQLRGAEKLLSHCGQPRSIFHAAGSVFRRDQDQAA